MFSSMSRLLGASAAMRASGKSWFDFVCAVGVCGVAFFETVE